mmetsp:Transcript_12541/g.23820  ORF Transcript_12541/g.23820 Transcript_12541/m.23820 type:complete len:98 (-) Transcript_12541:139-432(-)
MHDMSKRLISEPRTPEGSEEIGVHILIDLRHQREHLHSTQNESLEEDEDALATNQLLRLMGCRIMTERCFLYFAIFWLLGILVCLIGYSIFAAKSNS